LNPVNITGSKYHGENNMVKKWLNRFLAYSMTILLEGIMTGVYALPPNITLIADPSVLKIAIHDNHEPLIDLSKQTVILYGPSPEIPNNYNYTFLRKTVYEKLKKANAQLPKGMHFCLYEGYRSLELQKKIFDEQYNKVKARHSNWSLDNIFNETTKLVSPVSNRDGSKNIPPHSTGGAIDVYLVDELGKPLDMGIHPKDWMQDKEGALSITNSTLISAEARKNRHIMSQLLSKAGFVNYPTEYWHWSYGDKYWAFIKKQPFAMYGSLSKE
jgi:D-alanyl-D-alanine dipeptidase